MTSRPLLPAWKERTETTHSSIVQHLSSDTGKNSEVLLLGDSMLERWKTTGAPVWQEHNMDQYHIANAGVGGDGTQHVLWRMQEGKLLDYITPQKVILLLGTNNVERDQEQDICSAIEKVIDLIQERFPQCKIVLYGVLPRGDKKQRQKITNKINNLNKLLSEIERPNLSYRYFGNKFLTENGEWNEEYFDDHVHLNERAHREIYIHELLTDVRATE